MKQAIGVVALAFGVSCGSPQRSGMKSPAEPAPAAKAPVVQTQEAAAGPVLADSPAAKAFKAWLEVFNSGDEARLRAFAEQHKSPDIVDMRFRQMTGGFDLVSIEKADRLELTVVVKEKASPKTAVGWFKITDTDPPEIVTLNFLLIPPGMTAADMNKKLDSETRSRVLDAIVAKLTDVYVFPDVAKKMEQALRDNQKNGAYDVVVDSRAFADLLTEQLQAVSHDRHLRVNFTPMTLPKGDPEPSAEDKARFRDQLEKMNCGFEKAERLDGNIGYIKFDMFGDAEICGPKATAAFAALGDVDAIIFDLRQNGGGQPEMVAFVSSYLFAKKTHLNDIYERKANKTTQYWTKPDVPGKKLAKQPVFVLTSHDTFSGAEDFAYGLKNLKRATIVGETTGGGAHPTMGARLDDHFEIGVPFARSISPITKTDWEGTGVEPDVKVPADQALDKAKQLAADKLAKLHGARK